MHNAFGVIISRITEDGKIAEEWIVARGFELQ
jgi:hypothetical protein